MKRARRGDGDDANLMLLSGIMITIGFIMTAMTVAQVASLEREAATEGANPLTIEWRFVHDRIASNMNTAATADMTDDAFANVTFPSIVETFRAVEAEKGFDVVMRLAGSGLAANKTEADLVSGASYRSDLVSVDGKYSDMAGKPKDAVLDGLLHYAPCPDPSGPASGCVGAVLVFVRLSDGVNGIEEVMLFGVNHP